MTQNGKRRKVFRTVVSALLIILLVGGTYALLTATIAPRLNVFSFGKLDLEIKEKFKDWEVKEVALTNVEQEGAVDSVVRCMIFPVLRDSETGMLIGGDLGQLYEPTGNTIEMGDFTFILAADWATHWFYKDGFFYYRKVLAPGETTTLLLTKVQPTEDTEAIREKYENIDIDVEVRGDSLPASGGSAAENWGITVSETSVSP